MAAAVTAAPLIGLRRNRRLAVASVIATGTAAATGLYDDLYGNESRQAKGLRGHLGALKEGRITTGMVKMAGIGAGAAVAGAFLTDPNRSTPYRVGQWFVNTLLIASSANLHNLLDLRPGRTLKTALAIAGVTALARPESRLATGAITGAALTALPADLGEDTMLGDTGANAIGALTGVALTQVPLPFAAGAAGTFTGLIAVSEKYSFTQFIESHAWLDKLDKLGSVR